MTAAEKLTLRKIGDVWHVCDENGPCEGLNSTSETVAKFLFEWTRECFAACEKKVREKIAETN